MHESHCCTPAAALHIPLWPQFLRAVSEGAVTLLLDRSDLGRPALRVVCRELLAGAVLRPLMMWCTPYYANKVRRQGCLFCLLDKVVRLGGEELLYNIEPQHIGTSLSLSCHPTGHTP